MKKKDQEYEIVFVMAELVRVNSERGKLTRFEDFTQEPVSLKLADIDKKLEELKAQEAYQDIQWIQGSGNKRFLYSAQVMTENYAKLLIRVEAGNLLNLIAETVREESRLYPRPTDIRLFEVTPFNIPAEEFPNLLQRMKEEPEYEDIKEVKASTGAPYLYSDQYMLTDHAIALTEWVEVIQKEIQ